MSNFSKQQNKYINQYNSACETMNEKSADEQILAAIRGHSFECFTEAEEKRRADMRNGQIKASMEADRVKAKQREDAASEFDQPCKADQGELTGLAETLLSRSKFLHEEISRLEDKLHPALKPSSPETTWNFGMQPADTPLGAKLNEALMQIQEAIHRLSDLQERAAL